MKRHEFNCNETVKIIVIIIDRLILNLQNKDDIQYNLFFRKSHLSTYITQGENIELPHPFQTDGLCALVYPFGFG